MKEHGVLYQRTAVMIITNEIIQEHMGLIYPIAPRFVFINECATTLCFDSVPCSIC